MNFDRLTSLYAEHDIRLTITKKAVKNINFRIKAGECWVSVPHWASDKVVIAAVQARLAWACHAHDKLTQRQAAPQSRLMTLWGEPARLPDDKDAVLMLYRQALAEQIPILIQKWQPIIGKSAKEVRIKTMTTRWGSCNTRDARIWLSTYLAAYPYECTEYVFVHELCHLIYANHGRHFWQEVKKAMPDYERWHGLLKGRIDG
ncbi:MAG: DUF45 domain-containing protein [Moraxella sp.]|nr:DUF45 domain-containing protein [Moraxella sp.]